MPLSQPARAAPAEPRPEVGEVARGFDDRGFEPPGFAADVGEFFADADLGFAAEGVGAEASPAVDDARGTREPAGFAGRRGVRGDSPFIALLMTARKTTTGAATRPPPSRYRYAITP